MKQIALNTRDNLPTEVHPPLEIDSSIVNLVRQYLSSITSWGGKFSKLFNEIFGGYDVGITFCQPDICYLLPAT
ncbi:hypothetical protein FDUTEX481_02500 [Tolypothrix sp. PCC 7601]|nr:hypothetical protein FDUTEX481_02500 [Tolypothrix sp. PCC 7601]